MTLGIAANNVRIILYYLSTKHAIMQLYKHFYALEQMLELYFDIATLLVYADHKQPGKKLS